MQCAHVTVHAQVAELRARIEVYNATHVRQTVPNFDPKACPNLNKDDAWAPWRDEEL